MHDDWHHIAAGYCNYNHPLSAEAMEEVSDGNDIPKCGLSFTFSIAY